MNLSPHRRRRASAAFVLCAGLLEKYGAAGENDKPAAKEAAKA